jgi:trk system potassium uptake protein
MSMHILIVGGGRVGAALAGLLLEGGHQVTVVDDRPAVLARLRAKLGADHAAEGGMTDPAALEAAGIRGSDVVAAVTAVDEQNLVIACLARYHYRIPRTVARIVDPARAWMYTPEMGVDVALNQADIMAHVVAEELSLGEMTILLKLRRGRYALVEERLHPAAPAVGRRVGDLPLPRECVVVAVLRDGRAILHDPATVLQAADELLAVVHRSAVPQLSRLLGPAAAAPPEAGVTRA